ncbi:protein-methionine-sulfoxide reductase catalytic subunit MsrP [Phaeobacter inhibens]|uniref:protein-methionine-sulfoxide reductase catalytic subunit MsrP n=1 Tax=Phaeobacter inhibens TaxID=221822 RepID=UPI0021A75C2D|nr:protein-methionine-sulfoxide reductase catalytic subunit MsrP [Phaeobacter inhibens]UWR43017.1 protein-methionine-sulfoxide reductase catalytic subunit MsrP [Phaeobacter inhibens]UWR79989.1 protein-methionine-sulfoxide reductase catalytic subunit MsrP [Phaeobacter inhibens]UWR99891.1 protein-methionine-sulfoxide reductase catalytic subunit MsrP [Phaeobacter inhibens]
MAHRWKNDLSDADVTPYAAFLNRRQIMAGLGGAAGLGLAGLGGTAARAATEEALEPNSWEDVTTYCNFYEFGTGKGDPAAYAGRMTTEPWSVEIDGLVERPGSYSMAQILDAMTLEDRIYRFRCVEAWSMVVPWQGFELADLLNLAGVQDGAKYVAFETLFRPSEMPGTAYNVLDWPYREGLRLDEAQHPLTIMATGIFGKPLPNQNGAPLRLVVPWKYGFKSIKSIVRITLTDQQPQTSWNMANAREYGFYSNVNPTVDHPRWSQASERRIGGGLFARREPTLMFNGYEKDVAALYQGMDLAENF